MARNAVGNIPIKFDATSNSGAKTTESTYSWAHICTGNDRILIIGIGNRADPPQIATSVTYNGVALTKIRADLKVSFYSELWYLVNPATGSNTVEVTWASASLQSVANATSYTNVHQASPIEGSISTNGQINGAQPSIAVTTVADNDWIIGNIVVEGALTVNVGTQRNNVASGPIKVANSDYGPKTPAGSTTLSWQGVPFDSKWVMSAVALRPAVRNTASTRTTAVATQYTIDLCTSGTATASSNYSGQDPYKAFDGVLNTSWMSNQAPPAQLQYDFGAGVTKTIQKYTIQGDPVNLQTGRQPKNFTFEGSNNATDWTTLDTQTNQSWSSATEIRVFTFSNSTAYRYYRFNVSANNNGDNYSGIGEAQMMEKVIRLTASARNVVV